jgi:histone acetyltransferase (RNA polymerase elongator complex component)
MTPEEIEKIIDYLESKRKFATTRIGADEVNYILQAQLKQLASTTDNGMVKAIRKTMPCENNQCAFCDGQAVEIYETIAPIYSAKEKEAVREERERIIEYLRTEEKCPNNILPEKCSRIDCKECWLEALKEKGE